MAGEGAVTASDVAEGVESRAEELPVLDGHAGGCADVADEAEDGAEAEAGTDGAEAEAEPPPPSPPEGEETALAAWEEGSIST